MKEITLEDLDNTRIVTCDGQCFYGEIGISTGIRCSEPHKYIFKEVGTNRYIAQPLCEAHFKTYNDTYAKNRYEALRKLTEKELFYLEIRQKSNDY